MSTLDITRLCITGPFYKCNSCGTVFVNTDKLVKECAEFEEPDQHICTTCYCSDYHIVAKYDDEHKATISTYIKYEVRTRENGELYRYYYKKPLLEADQDGLTDRQS